MPTQLEATRDRLAPTRPGRASEPVPPRIDDFLAAHPTLPTPFLVFDLDVVRDRYGSLRRGLPQAGIYYAVKANPDPAVLGLLSALGSQFDVASLGEIELCLRLGVEPGRLSYGNTVKKESDVATAFRRGVRIYAVDSLDELGKIVRQAPGSTVLVRLASDGTGADWPLSRKFGADPAEATGLLIKAADAGLSVGVSFHVGSQQRDPAAWDAPLSAVAQLRTILAAHGHRLTRVNLGGGLPSTHYQPTPQLDAYTNRIDSALDRCVGVDHDLHVMIEPGRYLVGDAGLIRAEVVLVADKAADAGRRWVYLDVGLFTGLVETQQEAIRYRLRCPDTDPGPTVPCVLAGPTCDSLDVLYEQELYPLPAGLRAGSRVDLLSTGAYTASYSSVWFNGFPPLRGYYLPAADTRIDQQRAVAAL